MYKSASGSGRRRCPGGIVGAAVPGLLPVMGTGSGTYACCCGCCCCCCRCCRCFSNSSCCCRCLSNSAFFRAICASFRKTTCSSFFSSSSSSFSALYRPTCPKERSSLPSGASSSPSSKLYRPTSPK
ncbi:unnamed protein product, partial [Ectocarpus sp. 12 AP-2014]